jgi:hypothetical protein
VNTDLTTNTDLTANTDLAGIRIPDSKLAREITELVRDTESVLLFHHSSRVYYWAALAGNRRGLRFDSELLYAGAMFHDMGLTHQHSTTQERFEVDSANTAREFLRSRGVHQQDIETVWTAIALHTTPGIPQHMHPVVALVTAGVEMDVLGIRYAGDDLWQRQRRRARGQGLALQARQLLQRDPRLRLARVNLARPPIENSMH